MNYIEIKERVNEPSDFSFSYVIRADVPSKDQTVIGADVSAVEERSGVLQMPAGSTIEQVKEKLIALQQQLQAEVNGRKKFEFYGLAYDGSKWTEVK
jgi:hypothetical protein